MIKRPADKGRNAFTLTEIAIMIGVAGIVLSGTWVAVGVVNANLKIARAQKQTATIVTNIRALYANQAAFPYNSMTHQDITASMVKAGVFPPDCFDSASSTTPKTPWGTTYRILAASGAGSDTFLINFHVDSQPQSVCTGLLTAIAPGTYSFTKVANSASSDWHYTQSPSLTLDAEYFSDCTDASVTYRLRDR